ncbi:hypothetical protein HHK36_024636 [Tetracentron sinense]|uniref:Uncharacterized protein n=1 Tax=Tetracentron sinense TaxID=13715 RepID=A0A834YJQ4_TETSI|nr:hypothetical protein HHK36_024636 [Tetracentron sinense]
MVEISSKVGAHLILETETGEAPNTVIAAVMRRHWLSQDKERKLLEMMSSFWGISIAANTQKLDIDNRISLRYYYRIADNLLKQFLTPHDNLAGVGMDIDLIKGGRGASEDDTKDEDDADVGCTCCNELEPKEVIPPPTSSALLMIVADIFREGEYYRSIYFTPKNPWHFLIDNPGWQVIRQCQQRGFHPLDQPPDDCESIFGLDVQFHPWKPEFRLQERLIYLEDFGLRDSHIARALIDRFEAMAIDLCSESSGLGMSPRISFSHDLCQTDIVPIENYNCRSDSSLMESTSDFDFCVCESLGQESSSADKLFSGGKILPIQITKNTLPQSKPPKQIGPATENSKKERLKEILATSSEPEEKTQSKSFWRFKRSNSLNCGNGYKRRSLIFSLPLLSRSNSTGSAPNPKRPPLLKDNHKQVSHKQPPNIGSFSSTCHSNSWSQKPPLKKNFYGSYGNGVRISPVLNVPPPYISKGTANLFGLGSFFSNGKDKNKKK